VPNQASKAKAGGKTGAAKGAKKKTDDEMDEVGLARPEAVMIMVLRDVLPNQ
jgi:hypothetical protein